MKVELNMEAQNFKNKNKNKNKNVKSQYKNNPKLLGPKECFSLNFNS